MMCGELLASPAHRSDTVSQCTCVDQCVEDVHTTIILVGIVI